jgi:hypothetical protein
MLIEQEWQIADKILIRANGPQAIKKITKTTPRTLTAFK